MEKDNLVYLLGEDVIELIFCYIFYPNRKFMHKGIEIKSHQQMQYRKKGGKSSKNIKISGKCNITIFTSLSIRYYKNMSFEPKNSQLHAIYT